MASRRALLVSLVLGAGYLGAGYAVSAQSPTYGVGRAPTAEEIRAQDISISPTGLELPPGKGTAAEGARLYTQKGCAGCHGATGSGGKSGAPVLIRSKTPVARGSTPAQPCLQPCVRDANAMAVHSPYATVMWDYISRGMPIGREGSLKPDEVYSLTAFLLFKNDIIKEDMVLDAKNLPQIQMPNLKGFALPPDWKPGMPRLEGYALTR